MHQHNLKKVMRPDRTINSDYDQTNFSVIPASGTVALSIQCAELVGHESRLAERSLHHLASLRAIQSELKSDTDGTPPENESQLAESIHHLAMIRVIQEEEEEEEGKKKKRKETFRQRRF